jgi:nitrite reductase/ring-hydroxylating ferredoxin subunit|tara:strand:- start:1552 stop:1941 length:390 start_codon:yes stop_codon:yes gene_type:complete
MTDKDTINQAINLCSIEDISDSCCKEFIWDSMGWPMSFFIIRSDHDYFCYLNTCPHAGHPLNILPDDFLTEDKSLILCQSHGAKFEISDGLCVSGPCSGSMLQKIPLQIANGKISIKLSCLQEAFKSLS